MKLDIDDMREEDETWRRELQGRDFNVGASFKDKTLSGGASKTRHRKGEFQGLDFDVGMIGKDETST